MKIFTFTKLGRALLMLTAMAVMALVGTGAVFAQQPTMEKLKRIDSYSVSANESSTLKRERLEAAYKSISGELVIPGTYNGNPVEAKNFQNCSQITSVILLDGAAAIATSAFNGCTNLTRITIPASMNIIGGPAFANCNNLTSVTFKGNVVSLRFDSNAFPGDLVTLFKSGAGGAGTYTRYAGSDNWTKQDGYAPPPPQRPEGGGRRHGTALNGIWTRNDGTQITISDNGQTFTVTDGNGRFTRTFTER